MSYELAGRIDELVRLNNSHSGNPRWRVTLVTSDTNDWSPHTGDDCEGDHMYRVLNTAADAAFNYEIGNPGFRVGDIVIVTMNGRGTIADMERLVHTS
jgi:hypothetical protein